MKRNKNENQRKARKRISARLQKISSKEELRKNVASKIGSSSQLEPSVDTASLSEEAINNMDVMMDDSESSSYVSSEISSVSSRSHGSLSFIRAKSLYNLAQEMNALVDEVHQLDNVQNQREGFMISGSVSDDDLDDLQRELANADEAFGDMFVDWDGKSIVVVQAESQEGITDIPNLAADSQPQQSKLEDGNHHPSLISLDESKDGAHQDKAANPRPTQSSKNLTREESNDFQPPAHMEQEHEIHRAPVSLKESTEGLQEESSKNSRRAQPTKSAAFRQLEGILAKVQEENRTLRTQVDQLQQVRTKEEEEYDKSMQEVEDKVLTLMERLRDKQLQYNDAMKQTRDERASLEKRIKAKEGQIQQLEKHFEQKAKEEATRRKKLEKALNTVQRDLERVDSVTSEMVQELDDASSSASLGSSPASHRRSLSKRDADSWSSSPMKAPRKDSLSDKIPEALTINHVLHMCQSPPKVSRMSKTFGTPPDMVHEIKMRNEKAVQVLVELKTRAQQKSNTTKKQQGGSVALDYGHAEPSRLDANLQTLSGSHMELVSQLDEEADLVTQQLSVQRDIIARLETKQKTMMESSRQRYWDYESELEGLRSTYDEQLETFAKDNESLNQKLANVATTIETMKSRHKKELSNLKAERHEIEKELLLDKKKKSGAVDRFQQENESLSRQLVQYNKALDTLRRGHEMEIKAHETNQTSLVEELKKLQSKYEFTVGTFHRQKEILMVKLIEKERAISEIELAQENTLKARQEEKQRLEEELQTLDGRCAKMKKERTDLLQTQKKKLGMLSVHLKELKEIRDIERMASDQRISELEGKLESLQQSDRTVAEKLARHSVANDTIKSDYEVAVEASDTSRTSCLDPMADEDDKVHGRTAGSIAGEKLPAQQAYAGIRRAIAVVLLMLLIFAYIRMVQEHAEELDSLDGELALLRGQVDEWKRLDAAKGVVNLELQNSLEEVNSKSLNHKKEALQLADQLHQLQARYESLQQEHADHLESYLEETSHEPLPRCFSSPTLAMVASFEEELKNMIQPNVTVQFDVLQVDTPLEQDSSCEEEDASDDLKVDTSSIQEESTVSVPMEEMRPVRLMNNPATVFELSKAGLEAELFLVDHLELLSHTESFEKLTVFQDNMKDGSLRFRDYSVAMVQNTATKLKNRLLPKDRRLINSEEAVWLEL